jgi:hypothetical protein
MKAGMSGGDKAVALDLGTVLMNGDLRFPITLP